MHIFLSAGEPSGDLHGANFVREFRKLHPATDFSGFGGERMTAVGCRLIYPLCSVALVGLGRVLLNLPRFFGFLRLADRHLQERKPDAVILIDYPGFNWWVARRARAHGIPVFYFVPPQLWGWGGWRVKKMRRLVDHVLCTLEFEEPWYQARGVPARYIGHPYFDELTEQQLNAAFVEEQQERHGAIIGLLPGSRDQEIDSNLPALLAAAAHIHKSRPDTRFLMACLGPAQRDRVKNSLRGTTLPMEVHAERTAEIIHLAHSCISVSGSVSLELLYRRKPSVMIYYANRFMNFLGDRLMACRYFTLVNLLADRVLFPEYRGPRMDAAVIGGHVLRWLSDPAECKRLCGELAALREKVMKPGACQWAARYVLDELEKRELDQRRFAA